MFLKNIITLQFESHVRENKVYFEGSYFEGSS